MKVVLASRNRHKAKQIALLLEGTELVMIDDVAPDLALEEPHDTFEANALAKARAAARATGLPAVADDSGLEVDALGGRPGVWSARYAGPGSSDGDNNRKLISELVSVPPAKRTCRYRCVAALVSPDGTEVVAHGTCEGRVVLEGRGNFGFGYDPHVVPEGETRTMAEIPLEQKLLFSHRARAFLALRDKLGTNPGYDKISAVIAGLRRPHDEVPLLEEDAGHDPFRLFATWLSEAVSAGIAFPNAMTLATTSETGRPSARVVLLKSFDERGFVFYTNYESRKGRELAANPYGALVFYWFQLERQVRIEGPVVTVPADEAAAYFSTRPRGSRLGAWASRQSEVIGSRASLEAEVTRLSALYDGKEIPVPPYWGGYRLEPEEMEFWQGRSNRLHDRLRYRRRPEGGWGIERLSP